MSLELPADAEPYVNDYDDLHNPAAYALKLGRPVDLQEAWNQHYDTHPDYWDRLVSAESVFYVGASSNLLSRLEDHRDGDVRSTVLTEVCEVVGLQTVWPAENKIEAFELAEPRLARWLQQERPRAYVHQR